MDYSTTEQTINDTLNNIIESATLSSGYKPGDSITAFLVHVVSNITDIGKIEDLWGPEWSVFLAMVAKKIDPEISPDIVVSGLKDVLWRMTGSSDDTPASVMAEMLSLSVGDIERSMYVSDLITGIHHKIATDVCESISMPGPTETIYLHTALGDSSCPSEAAELCKLRPNGCKPITKDEIPHMSALMDARRLRKHESSQAKQLAKQIEELTAQYHSSLARAADATVDEQRALEKLSDS